MIGMIQIKIMIKMTMMKKIIKKINNQKKELLWMILKICVEFYYSKNKSNNCKIRKQDTFELDKVGPILDYSRTKSNLTNYKEQVFLLQTPTPLKQFDVRDDFES